MEKNKEKLFTADSEDFLGKNAGKKSEKVSARDALLSDSRPKRRDEYHEGFVLRGDCL